MSKALSTPFSRHLATLLVSAFVTLASIWLNNRLGVATPPVPVQIVAPAPASPLQVVPAPVGEVAPTAPGAAP